MVHTDRGDPVPAPIRRELIDRQLLLNQMAIMTTLMTIKEGLGLATKQTMLDYHIEVTNKLVEVLK